jgi:SAM-dependent methyltransferase
MVQSCRRTHVDSFLASLAPSMHGRVLDIGGKKAGPRGAFRIPAHVQCEYLNLDPVTRPDHLCNAERINVPDQDFDGFLLIEVLEHLENPDVVLSEAFRILRHGGWGIATMPFMYPVHADPADMQRWTADKFRLELERAGFVEIDIQPMGGAFGVMFDILWTLNWRAGTSWIRRLGGGALWLLKPLFWNLDRLSPAIGEHVTTGWSASFKKPDRNTS